MFLQKCQSFSIVDFIFPCAGKINSWLCFASIKRTISAIFTIEKLVWNIKKVVKQRKRFIIFVLFLVVLYFSRVILLGCIYWTLCASFSFSIPSSSTRSAAVARDSRQPTADSRGAHDESFGHLCTPTQSWVTRANIATNKYSNCDSQPAIQFWYSRASCWQLLIDK